MRRFVPRLLVHGLLLSLTGTPIVGCGRGPFAPSKAEILAKVQDAKDRAGLEKALGRPDDLTKLGPIETWTYRAKDGEVKFTVAGETIILSRTADPTPAP